MSISLYGDNTIFLLSPPTPTPEGTAQEGRRCVSEEVDHAAITLQSSTGVVVVVGLGSFELDLKWKASNKQH